MPSWFYMCSFFHSCFTFFTDSSNFSLQASSKTLYKETLAFWTFLWVDPAATGGSTFSLTSAEFWLSLTLVQASTTSNWSQTETYLMADCEQGWWLIVCQANFVLGKVSSVKVSFMTFSGVSSYGSSSDVCCISATSTRSESRLVTTCWYLSSSYHPAVQGGTPPMSLAEPTPLGWEQTSHHWWLLECHMPWMNSATMLALDMPEPQALLRILKKLWWPSRTHHSSIALSHTSVLTVLKTVLKLNHHLNMDTRLA